MLLLDYDIINFMFGSPRKAVIQLMLKRDRLIKSVDNATDPVNLHAHTTSLKQTRQMITQIMKDIKNDTANNDRCSNQCTVDDTLI